MKRRWFWIVLVLGMLLAGGIAAGRVRAPRAAPVAPAEEEAIPVEVAPVQGATLERTVEVSGSLTSARMAEILPRRSGVVARVLVTEGARVRAGQPLVVLDATEAALRVRQAEAAVAAAQARVAVLEAGARPQERAQAAWAVRQAESALEAAQTSLEHARVAAATAEVTLQRLEALLRDGAVSQAQVDQARLDHNRARAQVQAAQAQVLSAQAQLHSAQQQQSLVEAGPRPEEVQAARAQVAQARAVMAEARQALAEMTIRAPFAGRVAQVRVSPGDFAAAGEFRGQPVAVIYDDRALEAEVTIGEREAVLIRAGQQSILRPEVAAGREVQAVVKTVTPLAEPGSRAVAVRLRLVGEVPAGLLPGTFVRGRVVVERRVGVLTVPRAAVRSDGRTEVWVVRNGVVDPRPVTVGLAAAGRVEVTDGLRAGELVVVLGPDRLVPGAKVKVVQYRSR
ncbi:MAG: efflux RND transporter periplasmic adaptor subunit [Armatimonadota bacterium]|nr:efflux RND transporter periplasmic adaptor subunit [Armatimonadota bacterium]